MSTVAKKLLLSLAGVTILVAILFWRQVKRAGTIVTTLSPDPLISASVLPLPVSPQDPVLGNPGAPLTLVEFIDLTDQKSLALHTTASEFVRANPREARLIWKDFPVRSLLSNSHTLPHLALWCAGEQKKFWPYLEAFLAAPAKNLASLEKLTNLPGISVPLWKQCLSTPSTEAAINSAQILAQVLGLKTAPALFINNKQLNLSEDVDLASLLKSLVQK